MKAEKVDFLEYALNNSSEYKWKSTGKPKTLNKLQVITDRHLQKATGKEAEELTELKKMLSFGG